MGQMMPAPRAAQPLVSGWQPPPPSRQRGPGRADGLGEGLGAPDGGGVLGARRAGSGVRVPSPAWGLGRGT